MYLLQFKTLQEMLDEGYEEDGDGDIQLSYDTYYYEMDIERHSGKFLLGEFNHNDLLNLDTSTLNTNELYSDELPKCIFNIYPLKKEIRKDRAGMLLYLRSINK